MDIYTGAIQDFAEKLERYGREIARKATATALSRIAVRTKLAATENISRSMTLRNAWTLGSVHRVFAKPRQPIHEQSSQVGSYQAYMTTQETGGDLPRTTPAGRGITTSYGAGEAPLARPRRKLQSPRQQRVKLAQAFALPGASALQLAVVQIHRARRRRERYVRVDLPGPEGVGIYRVGGGNPRRGKSWIKMVRRVLEAPSRVAPRPWLEPAVLVGVAAAPAICVAELERVTTPTVLRPSARAARRRARGG